MKRMGFVKYATKLVPVALLAAIGLTTSAAGAEEHGSLKGPTRTTCSPPPPIRSQDLRKLDIAPYRGKANSRTDFGGGRHGGESKTKKPPTATGNHAPQGPSTTTQRM